MLGVEFIGEISCGSLGMLFKTCKFFRDTIRRDYRKHMRAERLLMNRNTDEIIAALQSVSSITVVDMGDVLIAEIAVRCVFEDLPWNLFGEELLRGPEVTFERRRPILNLVCSVFELFIEHRCVVSVSIDYLKKFFNSARTYTLIHRYQSPRIIALVERTFNQYMQDMSISKRLILLCVDLLEFDGDSLNDRFRFHVDFPVVILRCLKTHFQCLSSLMRLTGLYVLWNFNENLRHADVLVENGFIEFVLDVARLHPHDEEINRVVGHTLDIACRGEGRTNAINRVMILGAMDILVERSNLYSDTPRISDPINATIRLFTELGLVSSIERT
jgi:hypothetical protein